jgi:hypothetical protein
MAAEGISRATAYRRLETFVSNLPQPVPMYRRRKGQIKGTLSGTDKFSGVAQQVNKSMAGVEKTPRSASQSAERNSRQMADAGGGDSSHEVTVHFVDAPAGMRSGVTRADGNAKLSLQTSYAMSAPF